MKTLDPALGYTVFDSYERPILLRLQDSSRESHLFSLTTSEAIGLAEALLRRVHAKGRG